MQTDYDRSLEPPPDRTGPYKVLVTITREYEWSGEGAPDLEAIKDYFKRNDGEYVDEFVKAEILEE
jgi:hypothetical protein